MSLVRFLVAIAIAVPLYGACVETLAPYKTADLSWAEYPRLQDIAWVDSENVALATWHGVSVYSIPHGRASWLVPLDTVENVMRVSSDGRTIVAANAMYSMIAVDAESGKVVAQTNNLPVRVTDLAYGSGQLTILGTTNGKNVPAAMLYAGDITEPIEKYRAIGPLDADQALVARLALVTQGGSVVREPDGTIETIVPWRAGMQHVSASGTLQQHDAGSLSALMVPEVDDLMKRYASDFPGRYTNILNKQPIADDIVATDQGTAVVVRHVESDRVHWSLWFVDGHAVRRKVDLAAEQAYPYGGHFRCDARGGQVACVFLTLTKVGEPPAFNRLLLFNLGDVHRAPGCK
jgi:hypothetical protein